VLPYWKTEQKVNGEDYAYCGILVVVGITLAPHVVIRRFSPTRNHCQKNIIADKLQRALNGGITTLKAISYGIDTKLRKGFF
jgi:hypothetical protein